MGGGDGAANGEVRDPEQSEQHRVLPEHLSAVRVGYGANCSTRRCCSSRESSAPPGGSGR